MNVLERAKQRYNEIPIPDELSGRIQLEVRLAKERQAEDEKREKVKLPKRSTEYLTETKSFKLTKEFKKLSTISMIMNR